MQKLGIWGSTKDHPAQPVWLEVYAEDHVLDMGSDSLH